MALIPLLLGCLCAAVGATSADDIAPIVPTKPDPTDKAAVARWLLAQASWGVVATSSLHLAGKPFGNPISLAESLGDGVPYFYTSALDASQQDLAVKPQCSLALSEASLDCGSLKLDPQDAGCARVTLSGTMVLVNDTEEVSQAKSVLFQRHPAMKDWPADHNFGVHKLRIDHVFLVDDLGGSVEVPLEAYKAAAWHGAAVPISAFSRLPAQQKPPVEAHAATARWLAHESLWGTLVTASKQLGGRAFGHPVSFSDGPASNGTGVPYLYLSKNDVSAHDVQHSGTATLTLSQASVDCQLTRGLDPEDPRCVRLSLTGALERVTAADELPFARQAVFSAHPAMAHVPAHDYVFFKLRVQHIWLIDFFGGAIDVSTGDYFKSGGAGATVVAQWQLSMRLDAAFLV